MGEVTVKKRVIIFSAMNDAEIDAFYTLLEQTNPDIDGLFRPQSFDETDTVVYLLDSWSAAQNAPGAQELPYIFERVYQVKSPALAHGTYIELNDGRFLQFIFYSLSDGGYAPLKCFALHLAIEIKRELGDEFQNNTFSDCTE
ncbi:hypothetical protein GO984_10340 [Rhodobacteraceae bacterium CY05]|uniref:Uncharacterized protein n=2 Tax=Parasedimentitalea huanghaiensis TaxID=2682100 RepID=A0A6L6WFY8_9RHOB|nr:hypothetical protein [Zongyanglinia huanghaiensis]